MPAVSTSEKLKNGQKSLLRGKHPVTYANLYSECRPEKEGKKKKIQKQEHQEINHGSHATDAFIFPN